MKTILVTGANGFIGKNLVEHLSRMEGISILRFGRENSLEDLEQYTKKADFVYHLAGVNRTENEADFKKVNENLTEKLIEFMEKAESKATIVVSSTIQADQENAYGRSKKAMEEILLDHKKRAGTHVYIYRLPNVFGKWGKPNYNSVVSTFCYNISHEKEIWISDRKKEVELVYIDDVVKEFIGLLDNEKDDEGFRNVSPTFKITLGELADRIYELRNIRKTSVIPDLSDDFTKRLYSTYLSYLGKDDFSYNPEIKADERGKLFELIKSKQFGQIFVSTTHKGIVRGNHYHDTKVEKFCLIKGKAVIKFRNILNDEVISYEVSDDDIKIVDIPPGYTHSIENTGEGDMIVLFWANEIFDQNNPDTYHEKV